MSKKKKKRTKPTRDSASPVRTSPEIQPTENPARMGKAASGIPKLLLLLLAVIVIAALIFALRGKFSGKAPIKTGEDWNLLLITLDTTRADRLGCYGYEKALTPNLDHLASTGFKFKNAYCQVPLTLPSHASILTGLNPYRHGVHNNGNYFLRPEFNTLAEILKENGLRTAAFVSSFTLDSRFGLDQGFDHYDDSFEPGEPFKSINAERPADRVFEAFARWYQNNYRDRFFVWVHFFDPHYPYTPPPEFAWKLSDPYDGEIAFMDRYVGRIIDELRITGQYDRTLIVIAGDHGEAFGEKVEQGHGIFLYEMSLRVPFILVIPGQVEGQDIEYPARLTDILPTVLDLLGIKNETGVDGQSLKPVLNGKKLREPEIYLETFFPRENFGWSELTGIISGGWKYIQAPRPELYHLKTDPGEKNNLIESENRTAARLRSKLEHLIREASGVSARRKLTPQEEERLRSLGYLQVAGRVAGRTLPDPKDKLKEIELYQKAADLETRGRLAEAEEVFAEILTLAPEVESSYINLARVQGLRKNYDRAISTLRTGIQKFPDSDLLLSKLGHTLMLVGRTDEALQTMEKALAINSLNYDALVVSSMILESAGKYEEALTFIERALLIEPENEFLRLSKAENLVRLNRLKEASSIYARLVEDFPDNAFYALNAAVVYNLLGEYEQALPVAQKLVLIEPGPKAYLQLAIASLGAGYLPEAARAFEAYLANPRGEDPENIKRAEEKLAETRKKLY
ncbi:MAG: sulfatase-like hydrolase/transferase [Candidatus Saccharicenans sp.]